MSGWHITNVDRPNIQSEYLGAADFTFETKHIDSEVVTDLKRVLFTRVCVCDGIEELAAEVTHTVLMKRVVPDILKQVWVTVKGHDQSQLLATELEELSCEAGQSTHEPSVEVTVESEEVTVESEDSDTVAMRDLGLPTGFGGVSKKRRRNRHKRARGGAELIGMVGEESESAVPEPLTAEEVDIRVQSYVRQHGNYLMNSRWWLLYAHCMQTQTKTLMLRQLQGSADGSSRLSHVELDVRMPNMTDRSLLFFNASERIVDNLSELPVEIENEDETLEQSSICEMGDHETKVKLESVGEKENGELVTESDDNGNVSFAFDPVKDAHLLAQRTGNTKTLRKYWKNRFSLFTRFDHGVLMDKEGWYSVTPESMAAHMAERICTCLGHAPAPVIVDAFCGVGGNSIQFALHGAHVIAIDMDPTKLKCCKRNAQIYGVSEYIQFVCANFFHVAERIEADAVFLSPPWGGPDYAKLSVFDLQEDMCPDGQSIMQAARHITQNIALFVPKNTSCKQLAALSGVPGGAVEIEQAFVDRDRGIARMKAVTAYYGQLIHQHQQ